MDDIKQYWRSLEELDGMTLKDAVRQKPLPEKEFAAEDLVPEEKSDKPTRRDFLKMLGFMPGKRSMMFVSVEGEKDYAAFVLKKIRQTAGKNKGMLSAAVR